MVRVVVRALSGVGDVRSVSQLHAVADEFGVKKKCRRQSPAPEALLLDDEACRVVGDVCAHSFRERRAADSARRKGYPSSE